MDSKRSEASLLPITRLVCPKGLTRAFNRLFLSPTQLLGLANASNENELGFVFRGSRDATGSEQRKRPKDKRKAPLLERS